MRLPHTIHPASKPLALKYFAEKRNRLAELVTVGAVPAGEGLQHAARAPAGTAVTLPTASLFVDFCASLMEGMTSHAYDVRVVQGSVANVEEHRGRDGGDGGDGGGYGRTVRVEVVETSSRGGVDMDAKISGNSADDDGGGSIARRTYRARTVVVSSSSMGYGVAPVVPSWWHAYLDAHRMHTASCGAPSNLAPPEKAPCLASGRHVVVVGGGMVAATRALEILESSSHASVTLIMRRALVKRAFDVDQGWWGTKLMNSYEVLASASKKLEACRQARPRGSLRDGVYERLMDSAAWGARLRVFQGVDVQTCERIEEIGERGQCAAKLLVRLVRHPELSKAEAASVEAAIHGARDGCEDVVCDDVEIACGSAFDVATHPVLGMMVARDNVEVLGGYPAVQSDCRLCEGSRVFVTGRGAMIAVGPCGGNMVGMRVSAERICAAVAGVIEGDRNARSDGAADGVDDARERTDDGRGKQEGDGRVFDPVKRVTTWTFVDGSVHDDGEDKRGTTLVFPLESSNALSLLPKAPSTKSENPLDPASLPCGNVQHLESYSFSDDGFRLSIITSFPEPIPKDRVRIRVTRSSLEAWFIGCDTAYHIHVARLYGNVLPERTVVIAKEDKHRVTIKLHKEKDVEWKFLKG